MKLVVHVDGIGIVGPGMPDWPSARDALAGRVRWADAPSVTPSASLLAPNERRRAGVLVKVSLAVAEAATTMSGLDAGKLPSVFTSSSGDGINCHALCETLASDDRSISPTRFHNSVHNAPAGYWSIATQSMAASTSLCAHDASFAAGLLEAATQVATRESAVLLVAADTSYPEPLNGVRPIRDVFAIALALSRERSTATIATLAIELAPVERDADHRHMDDATLDSIRLTIPAARCLSLVAAIATASATPRRLPVDYLDTLDLVVEVTG